MEVNKIINGCCLKQLKELEDNSVDAIIYIFIIWVFVGLIKFFDYSLIKGAVLFTLGMLIVALLKFVLLIVNERKNQKPYKPKCRIMSIL